MTIQPVTLTDPRVFGTPDAADEQLQKLVEAGLLPDLPDAVHLLWTAPERFEEFWAGYQQSTADLDNLVKSTVEQLARGEIPDPAEFARARRESYTAFHSSQMDGVLRPQMTYALADARREVLAEHVDTIVAGLAGRLDDVMDDARRLATDLGALDVGDPAAVAAATDKQRTAMLELPAVAIAYDQLRLAQMALLAASSVDNPASPRYDPWSAQERKTWADVFVTGVHEVSDIPGAGPPPGPGEVPLVRIVLLARRTDVWMPNHADLARAYRELDVDQQRDRRNARPNEAADG